MRVPFGHSLLLLFGVAGTVSGAGNKGLHAYVGDHGSKISNDEALMRLRTFHPEETHTYEKWPVRNDISDDAAFEHHYIQETVGNHFVQGHAFILHNPLEHFSFREPVGGCGGNRQRPTDTMQARECIVATNAGFFDTNTGDCLGTLVTDGRVQQNTGYQNAMFGMNKDGQFVTGYLDENQVANADGEEFFEELIAGVLWLVRDGAPYVTESLRVENMTVQETGDAFATIQSARTAIGHDRLGRLVILSIDGKSYQRGVSLFEMADLLTQMGVENAINLDGGGSATVGIGSTVVNQPSDECGSIPGGSLKQHCERSVTSITCIRNR